MWLFRTFRGGLLTGLILAGAAATAAISYSNHQSDTLQRTISRGSVLCGVSVGLPGFGREESKGVWKGFDVDFCRAISAAIFDNPDKVTYVPLNANERFRSLKNGTIDILSRNSTWNMAREGEFGVSFAGITYYDGQGFMTNRDRNAESAMDLGGTRICVQSGTTTRMNLADYFRINNIKYEEIRLQNVEDVVSSYNSNKCDVMTADVSQLHSLRLQLSKPNDHVILPDVISKEPLAPVVRHGDEAWLQIVKWTIYAMINAEELGVTSKNIDEALQSKKPDVMRLLGKDSNFGRAMGLPNDWAARILRHVGNYGEVFDRNVGNDSPLAIPRGLNHLWNAGGIQYAPPIR